MVFAEVDQSPAEDPAAHGEQAEPSRDQEHVAKQRPTAALRHLQEADRQTDRAPGLLDRQHRGPRGLHGTATSVYSPLKL